MTTLTPSFPPPRPLHPPEPAAPPPPQAERPEETLSGVGAGQVAAATLLVRHLPEAIPQDMLSRLFSHYGASAVRPCAGGRLRNCAFVDFPNEALATQAQSQLNRLKFLGKVLSVERASKANSKNVDPRRESQSAKDSFSATRSHLKEGSSNRKTSNLSGEPIAPRLGVDYPFPPHLEYAYPPPDGNILTNIVNALIAVPRFYVQVLHLMNKMNIPAPFRAALPTPPLPPSVPAPPPPPPPVTTNMKDISSDESEMESSDEDTHENHICKRVKRQAIVGPAVDKNVPHEAVGVKPVPLISKEAPVIKKKNPVLQIKINPKQAVKETTESTIDTKDNSSEQLVEKRCATVQEIEDGKLPPEQILSLPMFKNYSPGNPSNVLYLKNLAKDVTVDDFYFIFGPLFDRVDEARSAMNIKLMQEGRMRGQAFVTFPSVELAQNALNLVNGYVFKGKPIIIQFGRNPTTGKVN